METTNKMEKAAVKVLLLDTNGTFFDWGGPKHLGKIVDDGSEN